MDRQRHTASSKGSGIVGTKPTVSPTTVARRAFISGDFSVICALMTDRPAKKVNKSAFVRALPSTLSAKDVVAKAKAAGVKLSEAYVYTIRSGSRARKAGAPRKRGRPVTMGARGSEASFRKLVLDLGVRRSRELLDEVETKLVRLIAGQ